LFALVLLACSGESSPTVDQGDLAGWETTTVSVGERDIRVAVADDADEWAQGLMSVENLGDLEGMLFVFPEELLSTVWMKETPLPLDIAFFDSEGHLVDAFSMDPCLEEPCTRYSASNPFAWALETPVGLLGDLAPGTTLVVEP
jgi:uncharacterized membrane protein (UPF0127 family)